MAIEWRKTADGYTSPFYRIWRNESGSRWVLQPAATTGSAVRPPQAVSNHERLADAFRCAERDDRERQRGVRIRAFLGVGAVAGLTFVAAATTVNGVWPFVVTIVAGYVMLRAAVAAVVLRLGDVWGFNRDDGSPRPVPPFDRLVDLLIAVVPRKEEWPEVRPAGNVRVIHPSSAAWHRPRPPRR